MRRLSRAFSDNKPQQIPYARSAANAVIGLLVTLIATGILAMFTLYTRVATMSEAITTVSTTLNKHLENSVDGRMYSKDQQSVWETVRTMATKEEVRELRDRLSEQKQMMNEQNQTLREIQQTLVRIATVKVK